MVFHQVTMESLCPALAIITAVVYVALLSLALRMNKVDERFDRMERLLRGCERCNAMPPISDLKMCGGRRLCSVCRKLLKS